MGVTSKAGYQGIGGCGLQGRASGDRWVWPPRPGIRGWVGVTSKAGHQRIGGCGLQAWWWANSINIHVVVSNGYDRFSLILNLGPLYTRCTHVHMNTCTYCMYM